MQIYKGKCVRERNELTKNIFRSTQFPRGFISHLAHPRGVVVFTLRCGCQNCIINDADRGTNISYKNPPSVFRSPKLFISCDWRLSDLCCTSARYDCIILMETRFASSVTPCLSDRFSFSATPDFYIVLS